jgi:hypothetical protein
MKKFVLLHFGFEKPTPEIMQAWGAWFEAIKDRTVDNCGFAATREISKDGAKELTLGMDSITGYTVVHAESLDEAEKMAQTCPFIASIRVCEVRST